MEIAEHSLDTAESAVEQLLQTLADPTQEDDALRIYLGRRIVFGTLASGEARHELSDNRAEIILSALTQPADAAGSATSGKVPAIEIRQGDETVFRQERDGHVSINAFQAEPVKATEIGVALPTADSVAVPETAIEDPWLGSSEVVDWKSVVEAAQNLIDPLGEGVSAIAATLDDIDIRQKDSVLNLLQNDEVLLSAVDEQIQTPAEVAPQAQATLKGWVKDEVWVWRELPIHEVTPVRTAAYEVPTSPSTATMEPPQVSPDAPRDSRSEAINVTRQQFAAMPASSTRQFFQRLATDLSEQTTKTFKQVRQTLENGDFQTLPQTLSRFAETGMVKSLEIMGNGLEQSGRWIATRPEALKETIENVGNQVEKAGQWLSSRPQAIQEQRMARAALSVFERGHVRTQETAYEYQGFRVEAQGQNRFTLADAQNHQPLMRFEVERSPSPGSSLKVTILERSLISPEQQQALAQPLQRRIASLRHSPESVVGSIEAEQNHAEQSQQIGFLAKSLAEALGTDDYQGKHYRVQVGEEALKIFANDGRGIVFSQSANQVDSKLEQRDFQRFAQITQAMTMGGGAIAAVPQADQGIALD